MKQATRRSFRTQLLISMFPLLMGLVTVFGLTTSVYADGGYGTLVFHEGNNVRSASINGTCLNDDRNFVSLPSGQIVTAILHPDPDCNDGPTFSIELKAQAGHVQDFNS